MFGFNKDAAKQASQKAIQDALRAEEEAQKAKKAEEQRKLKRDIAKNAVVVTTGDLNCEYDILGIVQTYGWARNTVNAFFGQGGVYHLDYETTLKEEAFNLGGDAVIGLKINLECTSMAPRIYEGRTQNDALMELYLEHWYGTAVKIRDKEE